MYNKVQIFEHLDALKAYAIEHGKNSGKLASMLLPLESAITAFFNINMKDSTEKIIIALLHAGVREGIKYDGYNTEAGASEFPEGWNDIRAVMSFMNGLMNTDGAAFTSSIQEVLAEDTISTIYISNLVDGWVITWSTAYTSVPSKLDAIFEFATSLALGLQLQLLIEAPKIVCVPKVREVADTIYTNKHYREFIQCYDLDVYFPI